MKATFILLVLLLTTSTVFADLRVIMVELVGHPSGVPTANVYSSVEAEQKTDVSVAEAAAVLHRATNPPSSIFVYVLSEDESLRTDVLLDLLDGMRGNNEVELRSVEVSSRLSERGKAILAKFRVPSHTAARSP